MINPSEHSPKTMEEAVNLIYENLTTAEKEFIIEHEGAHIHHGFGTAIRNAWLWKQQHPLSTHFRERYGLGHADDMSGLIIEGVVALTYGRQPNPDVEVARRKRFWIEQGVDPLTQKPLSNISVNMVIHAPDAAAFRRTQDKFGAKLLQALRLAGRRIPL